LTEGEAAAIKNNDPTYDDNEDSLLEDIPAVALMGANRPQ
jgi:hypothetical protein